MPTTKTREELTLKDYAISWSFIGSCITLNNPFELVRYRMQVMPVLYEQGHLFSLYRGCLDCAKKIIKHEGIKSLFKGNLANMMRHIPSQTLVWKLKETFQRYFHYRTSLSQSEHIKYNTIIGVSSALIISLTLYPLEYIRQLVVSRTDRQGRGIWHYLKKTVKNQGVFGVYKGSSTFFCGAFIFRGTYFGIYDSLKVKTNDKKVRWLISFLATYVSIMLSYPPDTVRRRLVSSKGKYLNARECFRDIWARQGMKGLFLGWPMVALQSINASTVFYFYDRLITNYDEAID